MMLPSIDLDDPLLNPQAPSMALASHSTSAGSHPAVPMPGDQVFAAPPPMPDSNAPAPDQFLPGPDAPPMGTQTADAHQQQTPPHDQMFVMFDQEDHHLAPPQSAAHSIANEVIY